MPVTIEPRPRSWNARSIGSRVGSEVLSSAGSESVSSSRCSTSGGIPSPVADETARTVAAGHGDTARSSSASSFASSSRSGDTRSILVSTTTARGMPSSEQISRCSMVWGLTPSSAATTRSMMRMPPSPARALWRKRSCPGTSMNPTCRSPCSRCAKPRSMVMPRRLSSSQRSQSIPVIASTRRVLPWSICPAVPMITRRINPSSAQLPLSNWRASWLILPPSARPP